MATKGLSKQEIILGLPHSTDIDGYWSHDSPAGRSLMLSDGCKYIRDKAQADWLFDLLADFQYDKRIPKHLCQHWKLKNLKDSWILECHDLYDRFKAATIIHDVEFPLDEITFLICDSITMLAS